MGGSGASSAAAPPIGAHRRLRAAIAGVVTFAVVVTGGLLVMAEDAPRSSARPPVTSAGGRSPSPSPSAKPGRLRAPVHLKIERGVTSVSLRWDPPPGVEPRAVDHYEVFRDGQRLGRPTRARYDVAGLRFGTSYRFWVVAVGEDGRSSPRAVRSVATKVPPLAASRLSGTYSTSATLASSSGRGVRFFSFQPVTWSLVPQCSASACNATFSGTHHFGPRTVTTSGILNWSGGSTYTGHWVGPFGTSCRNHKLKAISTLTITMRATSARVVGGLWVASDVAGSIHEQVRGCGGVQTASYDF
ncbi:MAG: fibronectin type III domain-containing protein [Actinobacteria bacterium]|nr:fibronectin type III domain-containing protein [Actinomycetota bacterium]